MVQFNLLPDIKLKYIAAQRKKRLVVLISIIVSVASLSVVGLFFVYVTIVQRQNITDLTADIADNANSLREIQDLDTILTVQNQLNSLTGLHDEKPETSRIFGFLRQLTPENAPVNRVSVNMVELVMTVDGVADSLEEVNRFTDILKNTYYQTETLPENVKAFSDVVLVSYSRDNVGASYSIRFTFDPIIYDNNEIVTMSVVPSASLEPVADQNEEEEL